MSATFIGMNSSNYLSKNWTAYDIELIKIDLLNHFNTRVGERVMRPDYGNKIWDYLMEPNIEGNRKLIYNEALRICESDSRVEVQDIQLFYQGNGIRITCQLLYKPFNVVDSFYIDFTNRQI
jgi:phage baseplate assembly protein W